MARLGSFSSEPGNVSQRVLKDYIGLQNLLDHAVLSALDSRDEKLREDLRAVMAGFMGSLLTIGAGAPPTTTRVNESSIERPTLACGC